MIYDEPRIPRWMGPAVIIANLVAGFVSVTNGAWFLVPINLFGAWVGWVCWRRLVQYQRRQAERWRVRR